MSSAADLIHILQRRAQLQAHRMRPPGQFPAGWQHWFDSLAQTPGRVAGAPAGDFVDVLGRRVYAAAPPPAARLTRWQAFATLWRQQWHPAEREERPTRWFAGAVSGIWHVLFGALLLWLMHAQFLAAVAPPQGEDVVQIEYIGAGTPDDARGGEPAAERASAPRVEPDARAQQSDALRADAPREAEPESAPVAVEIRPDNEPEVRQPPPPAEQPLTVSEPVREPEPEAFVLAPTRPRVTEVQISTPELRVPAREVGVAEVPEPLQPAVRALPQPDVAPRPLEPRTRELVTRDVPVPLPSVAVPQMTAPSVPIPEPVVAAPAVQVRERTVPTPTPRAPTPAADASSASTVPPAASRATAAPADARSSSTAQAPAPVAGTPTAAAPGAAPSVRRADDWGDSTRNVPGGQRGSPSGLLDADGRPRLAGTPGSASPGQPPGTVTQEIANLDRAGTWLKRKPVDYTPTAFDEYWRPNETLLEEWVRRSIKQVLIPIPGTNKRIVCKVSVLALGGGCGISDPNLNEQPATARPPPDIPFKPHLQEDNGSAPPGG